MTGICKSWRMNRRTCHGDYEPKESDDMARNYKELQAKIDPASLADNQRHVREELQRMALEELRRAKQLTQADMAERLDVPQSSISRIERRVDMYLSTLRNYVNTMGGVLQIQAVFPDGGAVVISRFGDYEDRPYEVFVRVENGGAYRMHARPACHPGALLSTTEFKASGLVKTMRALPLREDEISDIRRRLENTDEVQIAWETNGVVGQRLFSVQALVQAGFEITSTE
jgi:DNA-binding XRE family transcriptional regulator